MLLMHLWQVVLQILKSWKEFLSILKRPLNRLNLKFTLMLLCARCPDKNSLREEGDRQSYQLGGSGNRRINICQLNGMAASQAGHKHRPQYCNEYQIFLFDCHVHWPTLLIKTRSLTVQWWSFLLPGWKIMKPQCAIKVKYQTQHSFFQAEPGLKAEVT